MMRLRLMMAIQKPPATNVTAQHGPYRVVEVLGKSRPPPPADGTGRYPCESPDEYRKSKGQ